MIQLTPDEIYVIKRSLEARIEWAKSESEISDEENHLASALDKLNSLNFILDIGLKMTNEEKPI